MLTDAMLTYVLLTYVFMLTDVMLTCVTYVVLLTDFMLTCVTLTYVMLTYVGGQADSRLQTGDGARPACDAALVAIPGQHLPGTTIQDF